MSSDMKSVPDPKKYYCALQENSGLLAVLVLTIPVQYLRFLQSLTESFHSCELCSSLVHPTRIIYPPSVVDLFTDATGKQATSDFHRKFAAE